MLSPATTPSLVGPPLQFGHRLRVLLDGSPEALASLLGVSTRTLSRVEAWSGPLASALVLLAEVPSGRAVEVAATLRALHGQQQPNAPGVDALAEELAEVPRLATVGQLVARPMDWVYWATSARAGADKTKLLAAEYGFICRPLLETAEAPEVHPYLFALRAGDRVLLAHDRKPAAWFLLTEGQEPPADLTTAEHERLAPRVSGLRMIELLPRVFRYIARASNVGEELAREQYRLFDNSPAAQRKRGWFSGLSVRPLPREALPGDDELESRGRGQRARMTRLKRRSTKEQVGPK